MKLIPLFATCVKALIRNPMRAALTILGIIIGIAAVIAMMEIGQGSSAQVKQKISSLGANTLNIRPGALRTGGISTGAGGRASLTEADAQAIARDCKTVVAVSPMVRTSGQIIYGNINWSPGSIEGGTVDYLKIKEWYETEEGDPFTEEDVLKANRVCMIGTTIVKELFGKESPIGKTIRVRNVNFVVVGVLKGKGANMMGSDQDDTVIMPWTSIRFRLQGQGSGGGSSSSSSTTTKVSTSDIYPSKSVALYPSASDQSYDGQPHPRRFKNVDAILVQIADPEKSEDSIDEVTRVLRTRHRLEEGEIDDFFVRDMAEISRVMSATTETMTQLLLIVAMISLVVGGVGIMNIMLVSVTERTREIGLRMAVGARQRDIMRQFLTEAVLLCLLGGALGILLGRGASILVSDMLGWATLSSPETMVIAVVVSVSIGVVFGWYPAFKASRLDPIDALRHE